MIHIEKKMGEIDNIEEMEHELEEGTGRLYRLVHFYEIEDYNFPSLSDQLVECFIRSRTFASELKLLLEQQDWNKIAELRKKMLLILQEMEQYQKALRNNQEEYELLLKIQHDYQLIILELNLMHQNQEKLDLVYQMNQQHQLINNPPTYSSLPRLEPKLSPFSGGKKENEEGQ
jgi:hypothetical protein